MPYTAFFSPIWRWRCCFLSTHYTMREMKSSIIKRLPEPRQYHNTLNSSELVWGLSTTHCSPQLDLRVFNTQQKCTYLPHLYSALIPSDCIKSPLPPFHRGGITQTHIHGECQMPVSHYKLTIGALIGNCKNTELWMPLTVFGGQQLSLKDAPKCASLRDFFSVTTFPESISLFMLEPQGRGGVQGAVIAFEGRCNLIWEIHCPSLHQQIITSPGKCT